MWFWRNLYEKWLIVLFVMVIALVTLGLLPSCGNDLDTDDVILENIQTTFVSSINKELYGAYWVETLEEYESLNIGRNYDEKYFQKNALLVVVVQWTDNSQNRYLVEEAKIEGNIIYPVIKDVIYEGGMTGMAFTTSIMTAEGPKKYTKLEVADVEIVTEYIEVD